MTLLAGHRACGLGLVAAIVVGGAGHGRAQPLVGSPALEAGQARLGVSALAAVGSTARGRPVWLAPDAHVGLGHGLTVGVVHSGAWQIGPGLGHGVCVIEGPQGCPAPYANGALDVWWQVAQPSWGQVFARGQVVLRRVDPIAPLLRAGLHVRGRRGRLAGSIEPHLRLGLWNRDLGNRDWIGVPVTVAAHVAGPVTLGLRTGFDAELGTVADAYRIPVSIVGEAALGPRWRLEVGAGLLRPLGPLGEVRNGAVWLALEGTWAAARALSR